LRGVLPKRSVLLGIFCGKKGSKKRIFIKKYFADDEEVETEVRELLRQRSQDFSAAGFDALVKRRDDCINVGGTYGEK
jgi:hypothetical protein